MEWMDDLIGFIIILFVLFFPLIRKLLLKANRKKEGEIKRGERIRLDNDVYEQSEEKRLIPPSPPVAMKPEKKAPATQRLVKRGEYDFHSDLEDFERINKIENRRLETQIAPKFRDSVVSRSFFPEKEMIRKRKSNSLTRLVLQKDPLKSMIILSEILSKPKSLRKEDEYF